MNDVKLTNAECPECYPNPPKFWRDADINPVIKDRLTYQRHANLYYHTLTDALIAWGEDTGVNNEVPNQT